MLVHIDSTELNFVEGGDKHFPQFSVELDTLSESELIKKIQEFLVSNASNFFKLYDN